MHVGWCIKCTHRVRKGLVTNIRTPCNALCYLTKAQVELGNLEEAKDRLVGGIAAAKQMAW